MSAIKKKTYHPKNRIKRALFKGAPSLFTTADLNRQIEALQEQMSALERRMGFPHTCTLSVVLKDAKATLTIGGGKLHCFGSEFDVKDASLEVTLDSAEYTGDLYVQGVLVEHSVDYGDLDNTSEISGAFFEDGTSKPAATHIVFDNVVTISASSEEDPNKVTLFRVSFEGKKTPRVYNYGAWKGSFSSDAVSYVGFSPIQQKQGELEKDLSVTKKSIKSLLAIEEGWRRLGTTFAAPSGSDSLDGVTVSSRLFDYYIRRYADILYVLGMAEMTYVGFDNWSNGVFVGGLLDEMYKPNRSDATPQVWNFFNDIKSREGAPYSSVGMSLDWSAQMVIPLHNIRVPVKVNKEITGVSKGETIYGTFSYGIIRIVNPFRETDHKGAPTTHYAIGGFFVDFDISYKMSFYGVSFTKFWENIGNPDVKILLPGFQFILPLRKYSESTRPENEF
jgi:hypothetical protein